MKAVRIHQFGGPEVLIYEDVPDPQPRKDEVLVRVRACALNHLDIWVRKGLPGVKLPHILGSDVRATGLPYGMAHVGRTCGCSSGTNRAGLRSEFWRGDRSHPDSQAVPLPRDYDCGR